MARMRKVSVRNRYMGKLTYGSDLLEELTELCVRENVCLGRVEAIGAVQKASLAYYDQEGRTYQSLELDRHLEVTNLTGNVSLKDGLPKVHAHVTLADEAGNAYGGHLESGTVVFAGEFILEVFDGPAFERGQDEQTGLPLWKMGEKEGEPGKG